MPIKGIEQPEYIEIDKEIRLRKFNGKYDFAFEWYQDTDTLWMLDGDKEPYTLELLDKMYTWWSQVGEVYFIEVLEDEIYKSIGDVSFKQDDMPILIGDKNYRKKQSALGKITGIRYKKFPKFVELMNTRYSRYNEVLDYIDELEAKGEIFVIRPEVELTLGRIEKNKKKLLEVYSIGYETAKKNYEKLKKYLEG